MRIERQTPHTVEVAEFLRIADSLRRSPEWLEAVGKMKAAKTGSVEESEAYEQMQAVSAKFYMPKASVLRGDALDGE